MSELEEKVFNEECLATSYYDIRGNIHYKKRVQIYGINLLENIDVELSRFEKNGVKGIVLHPLFEFDISERGKNRHIMSVDFRDRVPVHALVKNVLSPELRKFIIYDNCASLKGRGVDMQRNRLKVHLMKYYRMHGTNEGYILIGDFSKFFDNLDHELMLEELHKHFDDDTVAYVEKLLDQFKIDVSFLSDKEYEENKDALYNSLEYYLSVPKELRTGEKFYYKSVGIGSELSQILGIFFPTPIDNFCKIVRQCKFYGRYMDDFYTIHKSKEFLLNLLEGIKKIAEKLKLHLNLKKTRIVKLTRQFTFLKIRYRLFKGGKVLMRLTSDTFHREHRKLKKLYKKMKLDIIPYKDIENQFKSWRGNASKYHNHEAVRNLEKIFNQIFVYSQEGGEYGF